MAEMQKVVVYLVVDSDGDTDACSCKANKPGFDYDYESDALSAAHERFSENVSSSTRRNVVRLVVNVPVPLEVLDGGELTVADGEIETVEPTASVE